MTTGANERRKHFLLEGFSETESFRSGGRNRELEIPELDRVQHSAELLGQLEIIRREERSAIRSQGDAEMAEGLGIQVEFESFPDVELAFHSLARKNAGIELLNVRVDASGDEGQLTRATVFVPAGKLDHFENLIRGYLERKRNRLGRANDNRKLIDAIRAIRSATVRALWTDTEEFPSADEGPFWWEVWLQVRDDREVVLSAFRNRVNAIGAGDLPASIFSRASMAEGEILDTRIDMVNVPALVDNRRMRIARGELHFPERSVVLVYASVAQMERSLLVLNSIAELRRAGETAELFTSERALEQSDWLEELLARSVYPREGDEVPYVCILDTGVNRGHRLIAPALDSEDLHTVEPGWGTADSHGHGTGMAGLALAGDLTDLVLGTGPVCHSHRLESVKLLSPWASKGSDPQHHGYLTEQAVFTPEIAAPNRLRVFGLAITSRENRTRGRPSAWSAAVDSLAANVSGTGENPRLMVVSGGNIEEAASWGNYPYSNDTDGIHDPAQAWNALTVGAYTELVEISEQGTSEYSAVAPKGGLSPFSTTSLVWEPRWPVKPDVVFEGGNVARSPQGATPMDSLSLLTSHHLPDVRPFGSFNATSAATALATRFAAQVMAEYPELWAETVRALMVHSAEWTESMKQSCLPRSGRASKADYGRLIRKCGFGVPDLERALWSVSNSLTMVIQESLQPFRREGSDQPKFQAMNLHRLPWPEEVLRSLGETPVELRVTLSYFIEPNPSARGPGTRFRYDSHGLRFDVKRPYESIDAFRARINLAARDEGGERPQRQDGDAAWLIGKQQRHRGSLHADIWRGTAADLASLGYLAVYPTSGWWRTRPALKKFDKFARYALVVSIAAPDTEVDLYSEVENKIAISVGIET